MYTLSRARSDIDLVAKHATDIAAHMITMGEGVDAKLTSFKAEILAAIDAKFAELARTIQGEGEAAETSAVTDLGAQVSRLTRGPDGHAAPAPEAYPEGEPDRHPYPDHHEPQEAPRPEYNEHG